MKTYGSEESLVFVYTIKETNDGGYIMIGHSAQPDGEKSKILLIKNQ